MKRLISGLIIGSILSTSVLVFADSQKWDALKATFKVLVNGQEFLSDKPTVAIEGSTYLPLKAIGDALGVSVQWNAQESRVEVTKPTEGNSPSTPVANTDIAPGINISVDSVESKAGSTTDLYVNLSNIPDGGLNNCDFGLLFESDIIEIISVTAGDIVKNPDVNFGFNIDKANGRLNILYSDETGKGLEQIDSNGKFAKITFKSRDGIFGEKSGERIGSEFGIAIGSTFADYKLKGLKFAFILGEITIIK